jgi:hypothetical protein
VSRLGRHPCSSTPPCPQGRNQLQRSANSAHAAQILPFNCSAVTTGSAGGIGTSIPPTGTIRQASFSHQTTTPIQGRIQCCRRDSVPMQHMQLKPRSNCSATTMRPTPYHKTRLPHPNSLNNTCPRDATSVAHVVIPNSSNSTVQLFRHHHHVLWWDCSTGSTHWYHKTSFHIKLYTYPGTHQCCRRFGANAAHAAQILLHLETCPPPCAVVGLALR